MTCYCCYIAQMGEKAARRILVSQNYLKKRRVERIQHSITSVCLLKTLYPNFRPYFLQLQSDSTPAMVKEDIGKDKNQLQEAISGNDVCENVCCLYGFLLTVKLLWNRRWKTSPGGNCWSLTGPAVFKQMF